MTSKNTCHLPVDAVLLLGPTGVGKSPLGKLIAAQGFLGRRAHHMDFGSELRMIAQMKEPSSHYSHAELDFVRGVLERGLLLENEHFLLAQKIFSLYFKQTGFKTNDVLVLNGIPRHAGQAQDISSLATIHALIVLDCTAESIYQRLKNNVGGDRTERVDDDLDLVANKLHIYTKRTAPLIEHYKKQNSRIYHLIVTATSTADDAYNRLLSLASVDPPVTLVAEPPQR